MMKVPKDRIVELTLVVRVDARLDEDVEVLVRDYLESEGLLQVQELTRVGMTGTIDLPRIWLPATDEEIAEAPSIDPPPRPPPLPSKRRTISTFFKKR